MDEIKLKPCPFCGCEMIFYALKEADCREEKGGQA